MPEPAAPVQTRIQEKPPRKRKPIFIVLTSVLIVVLALLLLCLLPGEPVLGIILPKPKGKPVVVNLPPVQYEKINPPAGGGPATIVFGGGGGGGAGAPGGGGIPPTPPPAVKLKADGKAGFIFVDNNSLVTLTWETSHNPTSCEASSAWSGSKDVNGASQTVGPLSGYNIYIYTITCTNAAGFGSDSVAVTVNGPPGGGGRPGVNLLINGSSGPITIQSGKSADLTWTTLGNPTSCVASDAWSGSKNASGGSESTGILYEPKTYTYTLTCSNAAGPSNPSTVTVKVIPGPPACIENNCPDEVKIITYASFVNNKLVPGSTFPRYDYDSKNGGEVYVSKKIIPLSATYCLQPLATFSDVSGDHAVFHTGWSGQYSYYVGPGKNSVGFGSIATHCAQGVISGFAAFELKMIVRGPMGAYCYVNQPPSLPMIWVNRKLITGDPGQYTFTAHGDKKVTVHAALSEISGGPCLSRPPIRASLFGKEFELGPGGGLVLNTEYTVRDGERTFIRPVIDTAIDCATGPIESSVSLGKVDLNVTVSDADSAVPKEMLCKDPKQDPFGLFAFGDAPDLNNGDYPSLRISKGLRAYDVSKFYLGHKTGTEADSKQVDADEDDDAWTPPGGPIIIHNNNQPKGTEVFLNVWDDRAGKGYWNSSDHAVKNEKVYLLGPGEDVERPYAALGFGLNEWVRIAVSDKPVDSDDGSSDNIINIGDVEDWPVVRHVPSQVRPPVGTGGGGGAGAPGGGGVFIELPGRGVTIPPAPSFLDPILKAIRSATTGALGVEKIGDQIILIVDLLKRIIVQVTPPQVIPPPPQVIPPPPQVTPPPPQVTPPRTVQCTITAENLYFGSQPFFRLKSRCDGFGNCTINFRGIALRGDVVAEEVIQNQPGAVTNIGPWPTGAAAVTAKIMCDSQTSPIASVSLPTVSGGAVGGGAKCPAITLSPLTLPGALPGQLYRQTLIASGGVSPYNYSVTSGSLPPGLSLDASTGVMGGFPPIPGTYNFAVTAADANGCTGIQTYTIVVSA